jgi:hypothetical protein
MSNTNFLFKEGKKAFFVEMMMNLHVPYIKMAGNKIVFCVCQQFLGDGYSVC